MMIRNRAFSGILIALLFTSYAACSFAEDQAEFSVVNVLSLNEVGEITTDNSLSEVAQVNVLSFAMIDTDTIAADDISVARSNGVVAAKDSRVSGTDVSSSNDVGEMTADSSAVSIGGITAEDSDIHGAYILGINTIAGVTAEQSPVAIGGIAVK